MGSLLSRVRTWDGPLIIKQGGESVTITPSHDETRCKFVARARHHIPASCRCRCQRPRTRRCTPSWPDQFVWSPTAAASPSCAPTREGVRFLPLIFNVLTLINFEFRHMPAMRKALKFGLHPFHIALSKNTHPLLLPCTTAILPPHFPFLSTNFKLALTSNSFQLELLIELKRRVSLAWLSQTHHCCSHFSSSCVDAYYASANWQLLNRV